MNLKDEIENILVANTHLDEDWDGNTVEYLNHAGAIKDLISLFKKWKKH